MSVHRQQEETKVARKLTEPTTKLYDRRGDEITLAEVERIAI
jgi:hypothetical protein